MGRPKSLYPDETVLWDLAFLGFSDNHIATAIGCHQSLIAKRPDILTVLARARIERAEAIVALWARSSQGALRAEGRSQQLVDLVREGEQRPALPSGSIWESEGAAPDRSVSDQPAAGGSGRARCRRQADEGAGANRFSRLASLRGQCQSNRADIRPYRRDIAADPAGPRGRPRGRGPGDER